MTETEERAYLDGQRSAYVQQLMHVLGHLRMNPSRDHQIAQIAMLSTNLELVRQSLRNICRDFGDNDWDDNLCLADVIEKHLRPYIQELEDEIRELKDKENG